MYRRRRQERGRRESTTIKMHKCTLQKEAMVIINFCLLSCVGHYKELLLYAHTHTLAKQMAKGTLLERKIGRERRGRKKVERAGGE